MEVEDGAAHVGYVLGDCLDLACELVLRRFAEGIPGRRVGPAHRDHAEAAEVQDLAFRERHAGRRLDHVVDLEDVVVAAVEDAADLPAAELAIGHVEPPVERVHHLGAEPAVDLAFLLAQVLEFIGADDRRVRSTVPDLRLDVGQRLPILDPVRLTADGHLPVTVVGNDRDHHLARHVAAENDHVGLVKGSGVEELAPADLRSVDVRSKEDLHQASPLPP